MVDLVFLFDFYRIPISRRSGNVFSPEIANNYIALHLALWTRQFKGIALLSWLRKIYFSFSNISVQRSTELRTVNMWHLEHTSTRFSELSTQFLNYKKTPTSAVVLNVLLLQSPLEKLLPLRHFKIKFSNRSDKCTWQNILFSPSLVQAFYHVNAFQVSATLSGFLLSLRYKNLKKKNCFSTHKKKLLFFISFFNVYTNHSLRNCYNLQSLHKGIAFRMI